MIQFSELRISQDKDKLYVGGSVENFTIYNNVYVKSVYIEYYKNRLASGDASEKAICLYMNENDDATVKSFYATLNKSELIQETFGTNTFNDGLFYIYVTCDVNGSSLATADCGWDTMTTVGIVADWQKIYDMGMAYIMDVANKCRDCVISDRFIDFITRWYALRLAMETCDYDNIDRLWDGLFGKKSISYGGGCGCGR